MNILTTYNIWDLLDVIQANYNLPRFAKNDKMIIFALYVTKSILTNLLNLIKHLTKKTFGTFTLSISILPQESIFTKECIRLMERRIQQCKCKGTIDVKRQKKHPIHG